MFIWDIKDLVPKNPPYYKYLSNGSMDAGMVIPFPGIINLVFWSSSRDLFYDMCDHLSYAWAH